MNPMTNKKRKLHACVCVFVNAQRKHMGFTPNGDQRSTLGMEVGMGVGVETRMYLLFKLFIYLVNFFYNKPESFLF